MKKIPLTLFVLIISLLSGCGEADRISMDAEDASPTASFTEIDSQEEFEVALDQIGDAEGSELSGEYDVLLTDITYSSDCEADFVVAADFAIDTGLSASEVEEVLENGGEDQFITMEFVQDDGTLLVADLGDEGDFEDEITGSAYSDGSFRIVYGAYPDADNYIWFDYQGVFNGGDAVEGTFEAQIRVEDDEPSGSCTVTANFSGERI